MDIKELIEAVPDDASDEYKAGWADCVCWINDMFVVKDRKDEPIQITFDLNFDEEAFEKLLKEEDGKS